MSDKPKAQTKADLFAMLAEAVRNTQPSQIPSEKPDPVRDVSTEAKSDKRGRKARAAPKRTQSGRSSAKRK